MSTNRADQIQYLIDRADITETVYLYATGIDNKDFRLYRSIFTDEIELDFSSYTGDPPGWTKMPADQWVEQLTALFSGLDCTQHSMSNPRISVEGDTATCIVYMQAEHFLQNGQGDNFHTIGGYYTDHLIRTADGWKLNQVKITVIWQRGNKHIMAMAAERAATSGRQYDWRIH